RAATWGDFGGGGPDDTPGNVILHGENVFGLRVVAFGPEMAASFGFGQFDIDANAIARPAHATLEKITCIEQAPDLGRRDTPTFELEARRFSRNEQVRKAAERRDDIL